MAAGEPKGEQTVGMLSLGCPKNLVDGEVMLGRLRGAGYRLVADAKQADVIVVNTCAFIDRAKQESVDTILEMAREKEAGRAKRLVVTGCLTQRYDAELRQEIPEIDATLGTGQVEEIVRAVGGEATSLAEAAPGLPTWVYDHTAPHPPGRWLPRRRPGRSPPPVRSRAWHRSPGSPGAGPRRSAGSGSR